MGSTGGLGLLIGTFSWQFSFSLKKLMKSLPSKAVSEWGINIAYEQCGSSQPREMSISLCLICLKHSCTWKRKKKSDMEIVMHSCSVAVHVTRVNHSTPGLQGELQWQGGVELNKVEYSTLLSSASAASAQFSLKRTNVKRFATIFWAVSTYHAIVQQSINYCGLSQNKS